MDFLTKGLEALRGEYSQPQTADETIDKLCDRLASATLLEDRRAALLGLKGLSREYKAVCDLPLLPLVSDTCFTYFQSLNIGCGQKSTATLNRGT
jgi:hypothetical protein